MELDAQIKLPGVIKMDLNESNREVRVDKHLSNAFSIQNGLKQDDAWSPLPSASSKNKRKATGIGRHVSASGLFLA